MTEYLTEQEQVELLKNWIKQYSLVIIAGVALALIAMTGWRYWQERQANILSHASAVYDEMLTRRAQHDVPATEVQAKKLFSHYPQTVYAQFAALVLAREAISKQDYATAEKHLNWVIEHSKVASFRQIARIRLARMFIAMQKPQRALDTLSSIDDTQFGGLTNEVKGDAYLALHNTDKAHQAYKDALAALPNAEVIRPLLQMKYDNLATTVS